MTRKELDQQLRYLMIKKRVHREYEEMRLKVKNKLLAIKAMRQIEITTK